MLCVGRHHHVHTSVTPVENRDRPGHNGGSTRGLPMGAMTVPSSGWCVLALLVATQLVGCAARLTQGASTGLKWSVGELATSERDATSPGYRKSGGRAKDYRYVVTLEDTRGVGVNFSGLETLVMLGRGFTSTPRTRSLQLRLPPNGQLRVRMIDSSWLVIPQWFEGTERRVNLDPIARKLFIGVDDRGEQIRLAIEFPLEDIPTR